MERSGFLFSHECDQIAQWPCALCGKMICGLHTRMIDAGTACIACAQLRQGEIRKQEQAAEEKGVERDNEDTDDPYFWSTSQHSTWDTRDHRAFESSRGVVSDSEWEADTSGS
jgi:hypothetical protein